VAKLSENDKTKRETDYKMTGISIDVYLANNGEFQWVPTPHACSDKEKAKEILDVVAAMPADKRAVWRKRFDLLDTKKRCPVIQAEKSLEKQFDDFFTPPDTRTTEPKITKQEFGGETANGEK
jgi:hypothetical protein